MNKQHVIAAFDFDGTITKKDTFLDFMLYNCSPGKLFLGGLKSLPVFVLYVLYFISADVAKEKIFANFFKGTSEEEFRRFSDNYSLERLPQITKRDVMEKIKQHKEMGHMLVMVSASLENWIKPWAGQNGFDDVISTIPEIADGRLTGKFKTRNCRGEEKVRRFSEKYPRRETYFLYAYGNSRDDKNMFDFANKAIRVK